MNSNVYVGNLSYHTTEEDLSALLAPFGTIKRLFLPENRESVQFANSGFAFCEYENELSASRAIDALNDSMLQGRRIRVAYAKPKKSFSGGADRRSLAGGD